MSPIELQGSWVFVFLVDNSIVGGGGGRFEPQMSRLETLGDANQLDYKALGILLSFIESSYCLNP